MRKRIGVLVSALAALAAMSCCASANAAIVTVGEPSTSPLASVPVGEPATIVATALSTPGANLTSPVSGTIIRWRVTGFKGGPWKLRVLTPLGGTGFRGSGTSAGQIVSSPATQTFPTNLPIQAGQTIAVDNTNASDEIGAVLNGGFSFFTPPLADGASGNANGSNSEFTFTFAAEVLPPPAITAIAPAAGSIKGGTPVVITGANFAEVRGVTFGATLAPSFTVNSETQITAIAPASTKLTKEVVAVTTVSGTATSPTPFAYKGCKVPKLGNATLKAAKKRIRKAGCKVGIVGKKAGVTAKTGRVVKQTPKPGKLLPPGSKVSIKLG